MFLTKANNSLRSQNNQQPARRRYSSETKRSKYHDNIDTAKIIPHMWCTYCLLNNYFVSYRFGRTTLYLYDHNSILLLSNKFTWMTALFICMVLLSAFDDRPAVHWRRDGRSFAAADVQPPAPPSPFLAFPLPPSRPSPCRRCVTSGSAAVATSGGASPLTLLGFLF